MIINFEGRSTVPSAAKQFGVKSGTIYAAIHRGELRGTKKIGQQYWLDTTELREWITQAPERQRRRAGGFEGHKHSAETRAKISATKRAQFQSQHKK